MSTCSQDDPVLNYSFVFLKDCTTIGWFWTFVGISFVVQILRNKIWVVNSQKSREALNVKVGSRERRDLVWWLMLYTLLSFVLHIINFLLIVGGNIWFLTSILMGNLAGTYYFMTTQPSNKHKIDTTGELEGMLKLFNKDALASQESLELEVLRVKLRNWLGLEKESTVTVEKSQFKNIKY